MILLLWKYKFYIGGLLTILALPITLTILPFCYSCVWETDYLRSARILMFGVLFFGGLCLMGIDCYEEITRDSKLEKIMKSLEIDQV